MRRDRHPIVARGRRSAWTILLAGLVPAGCGGTGGAWLWWITDPSEKIDAEHRLAKGRLVVLIDDDKAWLADASIRPLLTKALTREFAEHKVNQHVVSHDALVRLRQKDAEFDRRGAREIGERLKADRVLHLNVLNYTLRDDTVDPAYKGLLVVAVKVLDVHATSSEDVRLWPRSAEGRRVEVTTDLHIGKGSGYEETLKRRLCEEMAEKIAKLFYDHKAPKPL